jgi:hypothetical protein
MVLIQAGRFGNKIWHLDVMHACFSTAVTEKCHSGDSYAALQSQMQAATF